MEKRFIFTKEQIQKLAKLTEAYNIPADERDPGFDASTYIDNVSVGQDSVTFTVVKEDPRRGDMTKDVTMTFEELSDRFELGGNMISSPKDVRGKLEQELIYRAFMDYNQGVSDDIR